MQYQDVINRLDQAQQRLGDANATYLLVVGPNGSGTIELKDDFKDESHVMLIFDDLEDLQEHELSCL